MADDTTTTDQSAYPDVEPTTGEAPDGSVTTLSQMRTALESDARTVAEAARAVEAAKATYEGVTRRIAYSSDEGHAIALRDHLPALVAAEQAAARTAEAAERNVRAVLAQIAPDRMVVDPATEIVAANRAAILGRVVETAPLPQLRDELKAAVVAGDRASMFVLANYLPARLAAPAPAEAGRPELTRARSEITGLLSRVREDLRDPGADPIRKLAAEVRDKAATARRAAETRRRQAALDADIQSGRKVAWPTVDSMRRAS